jgi:hypothetical protein
VRTDPLPTDRPTRKPVRTNEKRDSSCHAGDDCEKQNYCIGIDYGAARERKRMRAGGEPDASTLAAE